jgi:hypothetical protein
MKRTLALAYLTASLILPATGVFAADNKDGEKEQPRPAQESRGANTTGKESTQPSTATQTPARPATATEDGQKQPRPAQESRGATATGRDATKSPELKDKDKDAKDAKDKADAEKKNAAKAEEKKP